MLWTPWQLEQFATTTEPPFAAWQYSKFAAVANDPTQAGATADRDRDGRANLLEYAANTDPNLADATPTEVCTYVLDPTDGKVYLTLQFRRRLPPRDITYHVETSTDFQNWAEGLPVIQEFSAIDDGNGLTETVKARATAPVAPGVSRFIRLRVTQP